MSLLERLKSSNFSEPSFFERAQKMRGVSITTVAPSSESVDPAAAVRALIRELGSIEHGGIETPSHLFSLLHRNLHVRKGAILVPEEKSEYLVPIATVGIDITSTRKLRIQREKLNFVTNTGRMYITGEERRFLKPHLSNREFRNALRIAAFPFEMNNRLLALLLIFDSPFLDLDDDVLRVLLTALNDAASTILFAERGKMIQKSEPVVLYPFDQLPLVVRSTDERSTILELDLNAAEESVLSHHPHLDPFRLHQDLLRTVASLVKNHALTVQGEKGSMILVFRKTLHLDAELLIHQLGITLHELFGVPSVPIPFTPIERDDLSTEFQT